MIMQKSDAITWLLLLISIYKGKLNSEFDTDEF